MGPPRTAKLAFALIVAGAALAWVGLQYGGPSLWASLAVFGAVAVIGGVDSVVTRRHRTAEGHLRSSMPHHHTGLGAVLLGVAMLVPGVVMVLCGLAGMVGLADGLRARAAAHPGPITMAVGAWAVVGGVALLVSRWTYEHQPTHGWQRLPSRLVGIAVVLIGIGMIAAGRTLALDPADSGAALGRIAEWIARLLSG